jgi:DNA (cytosine-5)-methyltransferase 1
MRIVDLFCGAGGFSCGFLDAGFLDAGNSFIGVDKWDIALETYRTNILPSETIQTDIQELDLSTLGHADILIGSPPCQGFSLANKFRTCDTALVEEYLKIRDFLHPRWWVMEEVPPVGEIAREKGWFRPRYFKASDFGMPHRRKRLFAGNYPEPRKNKYDKDAFVKTPVSQFRGYYHGKADKVRILHDFDRLFEVLDRKQTCNTPVALESKGMTKQPTKGLSNDLCYNTVPTPSATDWKGQSAASILYKRNRIHDVFPNTVTWEVCAFVMGFPETYTFAGSKREKYMQIGNAVCPPISRAIYQAIKAGGEPFDWRVPSKPSLEAFL